MKRNANRHFSALRQLAALGLPGRTVLPDALELLRGLAGFELGLVFHVDPRYRLVDADIPDTVPPSVLADYAENFYDREAEANGMSTRQAMESGLKGIPTHEALTLRHLKNTAFWERVFRPLDIAWTCHVPLRNGVHPLANLVLCRPMSLPRFNQTVVQLLEQVNPWLCHMLARQAPVSNPGNPAGGDESAVLLLDAQGRIQHASPGGLYLLHQALGHPISSASLRTALAGEARHLLRQMVRWTEASLAGQALLPPLFSTHNPHGEFQLRAYPLEAFDTGTPPITALHIERRVPLPLQAFRTPRFLELSARERDVCLALLAGQSRGEIADRLHIKPSSVIQHTRSLYQRLGISSRKELLPALRGEPPVKTVPQDSVVPP